MLIPQGRLVPLVLVFGAGGYPVARRRRLSSKVIASRTHAWHVHGLCHATEVLRGPSSGTPRKQRQ